jgi:hypothetical protein
MQGPVELRSCRYPVRIRDVLVVGASDPRRRDPRRLLRARETLRGKADVALVAAVDLARRASCPRGLDTMDNQECAVNQPNEPPAGWVRQVSVHLAEHSRHGFINSLGFWRIPILWTKVAQHDATAY